MKRHFCSFLKIILFQDIYTSQNADVKPACTARIQILPGTTPCGQRVEALRAD
ncbi:MAG: hypothetical protein Q7T89_19280 [Anaerolineales bacterium]|nr:hypothetical protein [Anaerolineales bacterium]